MNELRINKDLVTHIKIYDLEYSGYYYLPEIKAKTWWRGIKVKQEEGIYYKYTIWEKNKKYSVEDFEKKYKFTKVENKYYEPIHIMIFAGETKLKYKRFNSLQEAKEYCDKEFPNVKTI